MFTKREEPRPAPSAPRTTPIELPRQDLLPVSPPVSREAPRTSAPNSPAAIGASMVIKGEIISLEELYVDGDVEGKFELEQRLTVGPLGKVRANIKAREVVIMGEVRGDVEVSEKIIIHKNGSLIGNIKTAGIVIDDGAYFKGSIDIVKSVSIPKPGNSQAAKAAS